MAQGLAFLLDTGSIHSINFGCSAAKASILREPMEMGFSTTYGDTNLTHASLPKTEGDMWEPAFDLDFGVLPLAALPGVALLPSPLVFS